MRQRIGAFALRTLTLLLVLTPAAGHALSWEEITPLTGPTPPGSRNAAAIYDPVGHRMVVFGGKTAAGNVNTVWAFDLSTEQWSDLTPSAGPAPVPRFTPNAVYDAVEHQMIIWAGQGSAFLNDVWAFDLTTETWTEFTPAAPLPAIRYGSAAVFDPLGRDLVTFAGFTNQGRFDDTWRFSPDADDWTDVTPAGASPAMRCLHTASYDASGGRMIIYGGQQSGALDDIWAFDLTSDTWADLTPATRPPGRWFPSSVYDDNHNRFLIFAGNLGSGITSDEVWSFDLAANEWTQLFPSGTLPSDRDGAVAIHVSSEDRMVVFGGLGGASFLDDVWSLGELATHVPSGPGLPAEPDLSLGPNTPNPFGLSTLLSYRLPARSSVRLEIFDLSGRRVKTLVDEVQSAGSRSARWDGTDERGRRASPGVYISRLEADRRVRTRQLVLLK